MRWTRFVIARMAVFSLAALGAAAVLGLASYQASQFINNKYDKPYLIFAIVVSALTLILCLMLSVRYSFRTHIGAIAFMAIIWLALASYTTDRIGYVQCESLDGQTQPSKKGAYNAVSWCRQLKAIMAFSWFVWALFMIAIVLWISFSEHEKNTYGPKKRQGDRAVEDEERRHRGGNHEYVYANGGPRNVTTNPQYTLQQGATGVPFQQTGVPLQQGATGRNVVYQQPGHNVVVHNGQVTQVPAGTTFLTGQQENQRILRHR